MKGTAFKALWGVVLVILAVAAFHRFSTSYKYKLPQNAPLRFDKIIHDFGEIQ